MKNELENRIKSLIKDTKAEQINVKEVYKGKFITILEEDYRLPNGNIIQRERIRKNNGKEAVIIVGRTSEDKYLLVVQNRINGIVSVEFPAGYIEEGEDVLVAAKRELLEETGYTSDDLYLLDTYRSSLGIDGSVINIVVANNVSLVSEQNLDESEYINYDLFTLDEIGELINNHYINGAGNRLAYFEIISNKKESTKH
jgi:ADP-ribose pyrophosphatase